MRRGYHDPIVGQRPRKRLCAPSASKIRTDEAMAVYFAVTPENVEREAVACLGSQG
jgi:hypothetical protein